MPSVEELLSVAEVDANTRSTMDNRIEIDADTRIIRMMPQDELFGVESDEKSERKYFKVHKIVGNGVDLSKLQLRINYQNASRIQSGKDMYIVTDATVYNDEWVYFSWELSRKVTQYKGTIYFIVCAVKADSNGNITNEWNTTLAEGKVLEGLEVETSQEQQYQASDYLEQLKQQLLEYSKEIKDTFPSDYTQMQDDIGSLKKDLVTESKTNYDVYDYNENRLFLDNLEKNKYIAIAGKIAEYDGWSLSDYLPVEKNETYVWTYDLQMDGSVPNIHYGLFDVNKNWIGSGTMGSGNMDDKKLIVTDENTFYVRISQADKFFTNVSMVIKKSIFDHPTHKFIEFRRYLKKSPVREIEEKTEYVEPYSQPNYDSVMRSIQRIGAGMEHPIHSVEAFIDAYKKGFRILLCDLVFTSDNVPVCNHDYYLNQYYQNVYDSNGNLVSTENPIYFKNNTYETLSQYSYGKIGYPLLKFVDMLKLVRKLGTELYVEVKEMTEEQCKIACNLIKQYGLVEKTSWAGLSSQMKMVIANIETARVSIMPETITDKVIEVANTLKTGKNKVFIFGWDTTTLTNDIVEKLIQNDIAFEQGTLNTEQDIENYFARGNQYYYCTGIESDTTIAGKVLLESSLSKGAIN